ncbi:hypothetical protein GW17_00048433 [Ensete ventricosum]|nr:hypothetical protein GW17_00048433 [Ensete ventricosum]
MVLRDSTNHDVQNSNLSPYPHYAIATVVLAQSTRLLAASDRPAHGRHIAGEWVSYQQTVPLWAPPLYDLVTSEHHSLRAGRRWLPLPALASGPGRIRPSLQGPDRPPLRDSISSHMERMKKVKRPHL